MRRKLQWPFLKPLASINMHTKNKGDISEQFVIANFLRKGWSVSKPIGDNQRFDLIVDSGDNVLRKVQVKTAYQQNGKLKISARSAGYTITEGKVKSFAKVYNGQVDLIAAYCWENDKIYIIDLDKSAKNYEFILRVDPSKNKQRKTVRWAKDYDLDAFKGC